MQHQINVQEAVRRLRDVDHNLGRAWRLEVADALELVFIENQQLLVEQLLKGNSNAR